MANKQILAQIMKGCVNEYSDCTVDDIVEKYIEGTPEVGSVGVHGSAKQKQKGSYFLFSLVGKPFSLKWLKNRRNKLICKYNNRITEYCFTSDYPKNHLRTKWLDNRKQYSFENLAFYGLKDYDSFLRTLYGNYMQLPPPEQRIVHSNYKIDFGPY